MSRPGLTPSAHLGSLIEDDTGTYAQIARDARVEVRYLPPEGNLTGKIAGLAADRVIDIEHGLPKP